VAREDRMHYTISVLLVVAGLAAAPARASCPTTTPTLISNAQIEARWRELGCDDAFGAEFGPPKRHLASSGFTQDFARGQIAVFPRWAGKPTATMANFVLSVHQVGDDKIHLKWGSTAPFEYELFNIRWDVDDHEAAVAKQHELEYPVSILGINFGIGSDKQQIEVEGDKNRGEAIIQGWPTGTNFISIQGCVDSDVCAEGWSYPVEVDIGFFEFAKPVLPLPPSLDPSDSPPFDHLDGPMLDAALTRQIVADRCFDPHDMIEPDGEDIDDHEGELKTHKAVAVMKAIMDPAIQCRDKGKIYTRTELRDILNAKILESTVVSVPGTGVAVEVRIAAGIAIGAAIGGLLGAIAGFLSGPLGAGFGALLGAAVGGLIGGAEHPRAGDYDMRLVGVIQLAYHGQSLGHLPNLEKILTDDAYRHLVDKLLTVRGGADQRREFLHVGILPTFVPESENHILMTESARFLTNQLIEADYVKALKPVPKEFDNDQNGMTDWMLTHLQSFVKQDFHEYNARPYTREAMYGISNLFEFAGPIRDSCWRSNPPDPTQSAIPRSCDVRRGARIVMDYLAARYALASLGLRRASPNRRQPEQKDYSRLLGRQSDSMTWRYLILAGGGAMFWDERHGRLAKNFGGDLLTPIVGNYRVPSMIADMMNDNDDSYFQRFYFDRGGYPGVEIYYRHADYLISAGGVHDQGRIGFIADTEDAWARPITLMPKRGGVDYRDFIRIAGNPDEEDRANTCVGPSFACGLNPEIPAGIPEACVRRRDNWGFIDFTASTPGCDLNYGYYVVFYREACDNSECRSAAGETGSFGFFQVTMARNGLEQLEADTLAANGSWDYQSNKINLFVDVDGRQFSFQPLSSAPFKWGMVSVSQGTSVTNYELDMKSWPLASGERMRSVNPSGCIEIDNPLADQRLILDYTDAMQPRRTRLKLSTISRLCTCPLPDSCLAPRYE
jgi:hypothetical protein